jgi:hypothetical protein
MKHLKPMKKTVIAICLSLVTLFSAQSQVFNGVKIDGKVDSVINQFKAKGYVLTPTPGGTLDNIKTMKGMLSGQVVELVIASTPKTKLACKVVVYFPEEKSWYSLKSNYNKYVELLTQKYGSPSDNFETWRKPYYEGDGYEIQALENEKVIYRTLWRRINNLNLMLEISKYKQLRFDYENVINIDLAMVEKNEVDSTIF